MTRWRNLLPDEAFLDALNNSGEKPAYTASAEEKKNWSNRFADAAALAIANQLRAQQPFKNKEVFPREDGTKSEYSTRIRGGGGKGKRVDVAVSSVAAGLEVGVSLKGGNFRDPKQLHFGKNFTGRMYELWNEFEALHEFHPHSLIVCLYFLPLEAAEDRPGQSSFASLVGRLRRKTGRDDPLAPTQFSRPDWSVVGFYVSDDRPDGIRRGICRFFDVDEAPPERGRPRIETTLSLDEFVDRVARLYTGEDDVLIEYVDPELD